MVMTGFDNGESIRARTLGTLSLILIGAGVFGKTEDDSIEDFKNVYRFEEAFVKPFAPDKPATAKPPAHLPARKPATSSK